MKIVFMGTPDFAVPCIEGIIETGHDVVAIVSQPDRPKGRGRQISPTPVAAVARAKNIALFQWAKLNDESYRTLQTLEADLFVVVAYGKILPSRYLKLPKLGCWNIHGSILPNLRGAAPIQWALINGYQKTGVSLMQLDEGMDTGPVALISTLEITPHETAATLHDRLSVLGAETLLEGLAKLEQGALSFREQDHTQASHAPPLVKSDGRVDWQRPATEIRQRFQGMTPWPGCWVNGQSEILKLIDIELTSGSGNPGSIIEIDKDGIVVATADHAIRICKIQRPNRKPVSGIEYARSVNLNVGSLL